jgi:Trk K+ transport system NAD-binding subunit
MVPLRDHVILCGLGRVGSRILEELKGERVAVIALQCDPASRVTLEAMGGLLIMGDARDASLLTQAGVRDARALLAVADADRANLEIALTAREMNPRLQIAIRIFEHGFARKVEQAFGVRRALSTSAIAGQAFAAAAASEELIAAVDVDGTLLRFCQGCPGGAGSAGPCLTLSAPEGSLQVQAGGAGAGLLVSYGACPQGCSHTPTATGGHGREPSRRLPSLAERWRGASRISRWLACGFLGLFGLTTVVFHTWTNLSLVDAVYFTVTVITTTGFGDISLLQAPTPLKLYGVFVMLAGAATLAMLYAVIADMVLRKRLEEMLGHRPRRMQDHVVVVGLGHVGYRTVEALLEMGEQVAVVERDPQSRFVEDLRGRTAVVIGDARREHTLEAADMGRAKAVAVLTEDDLLNLEVGLQAQQMHPDIRLVLRTFDKELAEKFKKALGIPHILSGSAVAAPVFVQTLRHPEAITAFDWQGRRLVVSRGRADRLQPGEVAVLRRPASGGAYTVSVGVPAPDDAVVTVRLAG